LAKDKLASTLLLAALVAVFGGLWLKQTQERPLAPAPSLDAAARASASAQSGSTPPQLRSAALVLDAGGLDAAIARLDARLRTFEVSRDTEHWLLTLAYGPRTSPPSLARLQALLLEPPGHKLRLPGVDGDPTPAIRAALLAAGVRPPMPEMPPLDKRVPHHPLSLAWQLELVGMLTLRAASDEDATDAEAAGSSAQLKRLLQAALFQLQRPRSMRSLDSVLLAQSVFRVAPLALDQEREAQVRRLYGKLVETSTAPEGDLLSLTRSAARLEAEASYAQFYLSVPRRVPLQSAQPGALPTGITQRLASGTNALLARLQQLEPLNLQRPEALRMAVYSYRALRLVRGLARPR
jgi:hypothetical protein